MLNQLTQSVPNPQLASYFRRKKKRASVPVDSTFDQLAEAQHCLIQQPLAKTTKVSACCLAAVWIGSQFRTSWAPAATPCLPSLASLLTGPDRTADAQHLRQRRSAANARGRPADKQARATLLVSCSHSIVGWFAGSCIGPFVGVYVHFFVDQLVLSYFLPFLPFRMLDRRKRSS